MLQMISVWSDACILQDHLTMLDVKGDDYFNIICFTGRLHYLLILHEFDSNLVVMVFVLST